MPKKDDILERVDRDIAEASDEKLIDFTKLALAEDGRAQVVLGRSELQKLFDDEVFVVRAEYEDDEEQLLITIEGVGLPRWREGQRPSRVTGRLLDSSYVMLDKDTGPQRFLAALSEDDVPPWNSKTGPPCKFCGHNQYRLPNMGEHATGQICRNCGRSRDE